jgi:hypothetical protein
LELTVLDKNRGTKPATINNAIKLEYYDNIIAISDIQLVDQFTPSAATSMITKSGYDVVPFADNFYPPSIEKIRFYAEVYNTNKVLGENPYLLSFHIESEESKRKLDNLSGFVRQQAAPVSVMMREISIKDLPSGNYNLILDSEFTEKPPEVTVEHIMKFLDSLDLRSGDKKIIPHEHQIQAIRDSINRDRALLVSPTA